MRCRMIKDMGEAVSIACRSTILIILVSVALLTFGVINLIAQLYFSVSAVVVYYLFIKWVEKEESKLYKTIPGDD